MTSIRRVSFSFVPGHVGVTGNEMANRLADNMTASEGRPLGHIMNILREQGSNEDR